MFEAGRGRPWNWLGDLTAFPAGLFKNARSGASQGPDSSQSFSRSTLNRWTAGPLALLTMTATSGPRSFTATRPNGWM